MKFFTAGTSKRLEKFIHEKCSAIGFLYTYFNLMKKNELDEQDIGKCIFLDSGAFTAYTKGAPIDIQRYISFIKKYEKDLFCYANLDVIGDVEGTWENQKIMEDAGLNPLPVFHSGEPWKYLDKCLEYDYFALGGLAADSHINKKINFFDTCFDVICDTPDRKPKTKVHGFGVSSFLWMLRYPFYSCDSTGWLKKANLDVIIYLFACRNERELDFSKILEVPIGRSQPFPSFLLEKKVYEKEIFSRYGIDRNSLVEDYKEREKLNCAAIDLFVKNADFKVDFKAKRRKLF